MQRGIGVQLKVRKNTKIGDAKPINILKLALHTKYIRPNPQDYLLATKWDTLMSSRFHVNRNIAQEEIDAYWEDRPIHDRLERVWKKKNYVGRFSEEYKDFERNAKRTARQQQEIHFFSIKNIDAFLKARYVRKDGDSIRRSYGKAKFCDRCLRPCYGKNGLSNHKLTCLAKQDLFKEVMPFDSPKFSRFRTFDRFTSLFKPPVSIFADFETLANSKSSTCEECHIKAGFTRCKCENSSLNETDHIDDDDDDDAGIETEENVSTGSSNNDQEAVHSVCLLAMVAVDANGIVVREKVLKFANDEEARREGSKKFIQVLLKEQKFFKNRYIHGKGVNLPVKTEDDLKHFLLTDVCCICQESFDNDDYYPNSYKEYINKFNLQHTKRVLDEVRGDKEFPRRGSPIVHHHLPVSNFHEHLFLRTYL